VKHLAPRVLTIDGRERRAKELVNSLLGIPDLDLFECLLGVTRCVLRVIAYDKEKEIAYESVGSYQLADEQNRDHDDGGEEAPC